MNEISKKRIELAKKNLALFKDLDIRASAVTGSIAKGYGDDNSDIDTIIMLNKPLTEKEFNKIVADAQESGGDLYHGTPEEGCAVYYYIKGIKCDFGFGVFTETETLINEMLEKPEIDLIKHLQIAGLIDGYVLHDNGGWLNKQIKKAVNNYPKELQVMMVNHFKKFHPEWVLQKMAVERGDELFFYESLIEITGNMIGIFCGLNKMYHPGKLKGVEYSVHKMKIIPVNFVNRYKNIFSIEKPAAVKGIYMLVKETLDLIDKYLPEVSTSRSRKLLEMELRK